jgi:hypothetical protein
MPETRHVKVASQAHNFMRLWVFSSPGYQQQSGLDLALARAG